MELHYLPLDIFTQLSASLPIEGTKLISIKAVQYVLVCPYDD